MLYHTVDGSNLGPSWMVEICWNPMNSGITSLSTGDGSLQTTLSYQIMVNVSVLTYFISYHVSFMRTQKVIISHTIRVKYLNLAIESVHCDFCICGNSSFTANILWCFIYEGFHKWGTSISFISRVPNRESFGQEMQNTSDSQSEVGAIRSPSQ